MIIDVTPITEDSATPIDPLLIELGIGVVPAGPPGLRGHDGWSALLANVVDGARIVQQITGWIGGEGLEPDSGDYLGPLGPVPDIEDATNVRGTQGVPGLSVTAAIVNGAYDLIITRSDGSTINAGAVRGQPGPPGPAATVAVGTVTTLPAGGTATVTNAGTAGNAILNFGIPQGAAGGGVSSIALAMPAAFSVAGTPITTSGTFTVTWATGYRGYTDTEATKLSGIATNADVTPTTIAAATAKTTPVDADTFPITDSADSNSLKKFSWLNLKARLKAYFDTLYQPLAARLTDIAALTATNGNAIVGNGTSWTSAPVGGKTLIGTYNTTSGAAVTVTSIPTTFRELSIEYDGVSGDTTTAYAIELSSNNGSSFGAPRSVILNAGPAALVYGETRILAANISGSQKSMLTQIASASGDASNQLETSITGLINAVRVTPTAGSFDAGKFRLLGTR